MKSAKKQIQPPLWASAFVLGLSLSTTCSATQQSTVLTPETQAAQWEATTSVASIKTADEKKASHTALDSATYALLAAGLIGLGLARRKHA
ncbi:hypothetical protein HDN1F_00830 [gamma proteobacterium HdN1]|nr:hypothetical protein HDN1F_00830 [gamma proteobacterium HdN1]